MQRKFHYHKVVKKNRSSLRKPKSLKRNFLTLIENQALVTLLKEVSYSKEVSVGFLQKFNNDACLFAISLLGFSNGYSFN